MQQTSVVTNQCTPHILMTQMCSLQVIDLPPLCPVLPPPAQQNRYRIDNLQQHNKHITATTWLKFTSSSLRIKTFWRSVCLRRSISSSLSSSSSSSSSLSAILATLRFSFSSSDAPASRTSGAWMCLCFSKNHLCSQAPQSIMNITKIYIVIFTATTECLVFGLLHILPSVVVIISLYKTSTWNICNIKSQRNIYSCVPLTFYIVGHFQHGNRCSNHPKVNNLLNKLRNDKTIFIWHSKEKLTYASPSCFHPHHLLRGHLSFLFSTVSV